MSPPAIQNMVQSLEAQGVRFWLDGEKVRANLPKPTPPSVLRALEALRVRRDEVRRLIESAGQNHFPYSLPSGVLLVSYQPKEPPVAIAVCSVVTDVPKFINHALSELNARLHAPTQIRAGDSVFELLSKLADCGLELTIDWPPDKGQT